MDISINDVKKIAELARIELSPEEELRHAQTISAVLDYMKILNEVDTTGVTPIYQVTGLINVTRQDEVEGNNMRAQLVGAFPDKVGDELLVPGVFNAE